MLAATKNDAACASRHSRFILGCSVIEQRLLIKGETSEDAYACRAAAGFCMADQTGGARFLEFLSRRSKRSTATHAQTRVKSEPSGCLTSGDISNSAIATFPSRHTRSRNLSTVPLILALGDLPLALVSCEQDSSRSISDRKTPRAIAVASPLQTSDFTKEVSLFCSLLLTTNCEICKSICSAKSASGSAPQGLQSLQGHRGRERSEVPRSEPRQGTFRFSHRGKREMACLELHRGQLSRRCPEPTGTSPDRWTPAGAWVVPPVPGARGPSDDDADGGDGDDGTADDPAEAANRDPLRRRRPRRRPGQVRRRASAVERLVPSSGDRPGCRLIRDSFEACRPYLFSPGRRRSRPPQPQPRPRRSTTLRFCASPFRRQATPTAGNTCHRKRVGCHICCR